MAKTKTIAGNTFLFTGNLTEFTRDEAEALVESNGGKVISHITDLPTLKAAKPNYMVVGEEGGNKLAEAQLSLLIFNAKDLGVKILTQKKFLEMTSESSSQKKK